MTGLIPGHLFIVGFSQLSERSEGNKKTTCSAGGGKNSLDKSKKRPPMLK
jgi:hypothetical protein